MGLNLSSMTHKLALLSVTETESVLVAVIVIHYTASYSLYVGELGT